MRLLDWTRERRASQRERNQNMFLFVRGHYLFFATESNSTPIKFEWNITGGFMDDQRGFTEFDEVSGRLNGFPMGALLCFAELEQLQTHFVANGNGLMRAAGCEAD